ncbi:MAG TPA: efflux transporter outer membrane subunit [Rhodocyclaceae bacterium]|nr:efflux transporter outer membrane subunit [Rhodocyclaceae bacterium]
MKAAFVRVSIAVILATSLAGCAVGPDFRTPAAPVASAYTAAPLPAQTAAAPVDGGAAQRFAIAQDVSAQWWTLFRSPALDALIARGLADSPSLAAARAALSAARENLAAGDGLLYPGVDAGLQATRQRVSGVTTGTGSREFSLDNASVKVSYGLDLFGSARRQLEALGAQADYQRFLLEAAYLSLSANIVTTAVQEASLRGQIEATRAVMAADQRLLTVVERQFELGAVARSAVLLQRSQLAATRATLPPLEKQLSFSRHALAALVGHLPGEAGTPEFQLDALKLPTVLPVALPSTLVRQRPDIRVAEALLHQASAEVGVATANLYPQVTLSAAYGSEALTAGALFGAQDVIWSLGAGVLQPVFHGGELSAKRRAALATLDQAAGQYRQTVVNAFQNVADSLRALTADAQTLEAQAQFSAAAKDSLALTKTQFSLGATNYLTLAAAQRDEAQARINLIKARAARYADTAALFQALGGGWWHRDPASEKDGEPVPHGESAHD